MTKQLYWEDIREGSEIPPLQKIATSQMLVRWAGATGDFNPLHYDSTYIKSHNMPDILVHGRLMFAWLGQLLTDWVGLEGSIKRITVQHRGMLHPRKMAEINQPEDGEIIWCKGKVSSKYVENGKHYVDCEIWVEDSKGERPTPGTATVVLPSRS